MRRSHASKIFYVWVSRLSVPALPDVKMRARSQICPPPMRRISKGGPMPPEARAHIAELMQKAAAQQAADAKKAPAGAPPAAKH